MSETSIVVIGGKGTAVNIAEQIEDARVRFGAPVRCLGFAIDDPALGTSINGLPIVCGVATAWPQFRDSDVRFVFALYKPEAMAERHALLRRLEIPRERYATFVHPSAYVASSAKLGPGTVVLSQSTLQQRVEIGANCVVNSNVIVEHEASIGDAVFVAAGACVGARVRIEDCAFVGFMAAIREDVRIGEAAFVGMSSTVLRDVEPRATVYGSPAGCRK